MWPWFAPVPFRGHICWWLSCWTGLQFALSAYRVQSMGTAVLGHPVTAWGISNVWLFIWTKSKIQKIAPLTLTAHRVPLFCNLLCRSNPGAHVKRL